MGEEAKQEQAKADALTEEKKEAKEEEKHVENPPAEEKVEEAAKPPPPLVLFLDLHCVGCAKKIERSIMRIRGVEGVNIDMAQNQVTIKGIVEPQAVCNKIMKKTKRRAKVLSPLPETEGEPMPQAVTSQVSRLTTVELNVNMHCEACAQQLNKKILKMRGVQSVVTEVSTGKVIVNGTMDENKLVDYVYRRTKKQAKIVPQPQPDPEPEKKEEEKPVEEAKPAPEEEQKEEKKEEVKPPEEAKKEEAENASETIENNTEKAKNEGNDNADEENMKRMMYYYQPLYVIERIPPPQLFSDENPNACCIT